MGREQKSVFDALGRRGVCGITSCTSWACACAPLALLRRALPLYATASGECHSRIGSCPHTSCAVALRESDSDGGAHSAAGARSIDATKRTWGDKDAWKSTLKALAEKDKLEYIEESDTVKFELPAAMCELHSECLFQCETPGRSTEYDVMCACVCLSIN